MEDSINAMNRDAEIMKAKADHFGNATIGTVAREPKIAEIPALIERLNEATMQLGDNLYLMTEKLYPVLRKEPINGADVTTPAPMTDLGEVLQMHLNRITSANDTIRSLVGRVEL